MPLAFAPAGISTPASRRSQTVRRAYRSSGPRSAPQLYPNVPGRESGRTTWSLMHQMHHFRGWNVMKTGVTNTGQKSEKPRRIRGFLR